MSLSFLPASGRNVSRGTNAWWTEFGFYLQQRRIEILRKLLGNKSYRAVLEIGCGNGSVPRNGISRNIVGIDISPGQAVTIFASAEYLPLRPGIFDLIFAGEVFEHLRQPEMALNDWCRVLKSGGVMIISTPNGSLVHTTWNPEHVRTYSPNDMVESLGRLGLRVTDARGIFTGLVSGRRVYRLIFSDKIKSLLLRVPVPPRLAYDVFYRAVKG